MNCAHCGYALWNLSARRCPECGLNFQLSQWHFPPGSVLFGCPHCDYVFASLDVQVTTCPLCYGALDSESIRVIPTRNSMRIRLQRDKRIALIWRSMVRRIPWICVVVATVGLISVLGPSVARYQIDRTGPWVTIIALSSTFVGLIGLGAYTPRRRRAAVILGLLAGVSLAIYAWHHISMLESRRIDHAWVRNARQKIKGIHWAYCAYFQDHAEAPSSLMSLVDEGYVFPSAFTIAEDECSSNESLWFEDKSGKWLCCGDFMFKTAWWEAVDADEHMIVGASTKTSPYFARRVAITVRGDVHVVDDDTRTARDGL